MPASLWTGAALGFSVVMPVGPISLLCVQNTLVGGYGQGVLAGLGAATAHGMFAAAVVLGAGAAAPVLTSSSDVIRCFSAFLLVVLGIRTLLRQRAARIHVRTTNWCTSYSSTLVLALSNPTTILPYIAVASASASVSDASLSTWSIPGVMLAASSWYAGLSGIASLMRRGIPTHVIRYLDIVAGSATIAFGVAIASASVRF